MSEERSKLKPRLPLWFRSFVAALFAALLAPYFLVRSGGTGEALARSLGGALFNQAAPAIRTDALLAAHGRQSGNGDYRMNGMLVRYRSYWTPASPNVAIARFLEAAKPAGYVTKVFSVQKQPAAVAIHPKSKVMLSMIVLEQRSGLTHLRLAQQNLGELRRDFQAAIPGIPVYGEAHHRILVAPATGQGSQSMTYVSGASSDWLRDFYVEEMSSRGWQRTAAPLELPGLPALFFAKAGSECSVLLVPTKEANETLVLVTLTDRQGGRS